MPRIRPKSPNAQRVSYSSLIYNPAAARYIQSNGRFMSAEAARDVIDADIDACKVRMREHGEKLKQAAQRFKDSSITQADYHDAVRLWGRQHMAEVKGGALGNVAAACGGIHAMGAREHGRAGGFIGNQAKYAQNFMIEAAANPDIVLSLDKSRRPFEERIEAYAENLRIPYEATRQEQEREAGLIIGVNILDDGAAHCKPSKGVESCEQQTAKGAVPEEEIVMVGRRACRWKCRCKVKRFKTKAAAEMWLKEMAA